MPRVLNRGASAVSCHMWSCVSDVRNFGSALVVVNVALVVISSQTRRWGRLMLVVGVGQIVGSCPKQGATVEEPTVAMREAAIAT